MGIAMRLDHVLPVLVEAMLPRFSADNKLLCIVLRITARRGKREVRRNIALLFHRPSNYTKVLWRVLKNNEFLEEVKTWEVKSNHDSCWRSDGNSSPLFDLYIEMCEELDPKVAPADCEVTADFDLCGEPRVREIKSYKYDREKFTFTVNW